MIVRVEHDRDRPYLMLAVATIRAPELDCAALGFLVHLLDLPDDWSFNVRGLARRFHVGKNTVTRYLAELKAAGFCRIDTVKNQRTGRFESSYTVYENPFDASPQIRDRKNLQSTCPQNTSPVNGDIQNTHLGIMRERAHADGTVPEEPSRPCVRTGPANELASSGRAAS